MLRAILVSVIAPSVFVLSSLGTIFSVAHAQEPPAATEETQESFSAVEEVIVTARRREESIQDVPIAVTNVGGQLIDDIHLANLIEMGKFSPNVTFTTQSAAGMAMGVAIRGVAYDDLEKSFEPTVGINLDGMFMGTNSGMNIDLWDVKSIEILRGPQGTLFGRNTIGGVVNITRNKPTGEFGLRVEYDYGNNDREDAKLSVNFPIVEGKVAAKINWRSLEGGAFQRNITRNEDVKGRDLTAGTLSLLFTPSENFDALLHVDFFEDDNEGPENLNISQETDALCSAFGLGLLGCRETSFDMAAADDFKTSVASLPHVNTIEGGSATLGMNWNLGNYLLTSVTGYQDFEELLDVPFEGAPVLVTQFIRPQEYEQFSQELRVASDLESRLNYVAGIYYFSSEYTTTQDFRFFGGQAQLFTSNQNLTALAIFGEASYEISDALRFTFGGRWTDEEKKFDHAHPVEASGPFAFKGKDSWSEFTHRLGLDYNFNDDVMGYVSWSTGFRSGGWNGRPATIGGVGPYDPETVDNYEIGIRSEWFDKRLTFNVTGFYMQYKDKQEFNVVANAETGQFDTKVENAAKVTHKGLEIEGLARPLENHDLTLRFSLGLLDVEIGEWLRLGVDVSDMAEPIYAPEVTAGFGASYNRLIGASTLNLTANWTYTDEHRGRSEIPVEPFGRDIVPSYSVLDLAANLRMPFGENNTFFLSLYGTDILEDGGENNRPVEIRPLFYIVGPRVRRQYGVKIGVEF